MLLVKDKNYKLKAIPKEEVVEKKKITKLLNRITESLYYRKDIARARKDLATYSRKKYGLILRKHNHVIYILNEDGLNYIQKDFDDILMLLSKDIGSEMISNKDLEEALGYISVRLEPTPNKVKFANATYDMDKMEIIVPEKPILTIIESKYNYNPTAESTIFKNFLNTSLKRETDEETEEYIEGVFQAVGYAFTSGNILTILLIITGISGAGKSVFINIITAIFGKDKIADLKLQEMEKNTHGTSSLVNKHLNIVNDSDASSISNNSYIKQLTGNDSIQINPKYKQPYVLSKEEVPKSIIVCNNIPNFTKLEPALIERFLIIEFNHKFRDTEEQNPNLLEDILSNPEEVEWFIYNCLRAYKEMREKGEDFILKKTASETKIIVDKHQHPINYILNKFIDDVGDVDVDNYVYTNDLNKAILYQAEKEGLDIVTDKNDRISPRELINAIRSEFDLYEGGIYNTNTHGGERYYPKLKANQFYWDTIKKIKEE